MSNPHLYTKASLLEGTNYEPPHYQGNQSKEMEGGEEEVVEEEQEEECPLPVPGPSGTHLEIPHSEHNSPEPYLERLREQLDEHLGMLIETTFQLPESLVSD